MTEVITLPEFEKNLKRLAKKYASLPHDFEHFLSLIESEGVQGSSLGNGLFKARMAVKSKGKGKSGGLRIISYDEVILSHDEDTIYLVAIYDKSETSTLEIRKMNHILKNNGL